MSVLTLQVLLDGAWHRAATLEVPREAEGAGGACYFEYDFAYLDAWLDRGRFDALVSARLPLEFGPALQPAWPSFLDDVRPMGSARRWWLARLGLPDAPSSDFLLVREGTAAPIGNLRVEESVPPRGPPPRRFPLTAVVAREHDFIVWAAEHGAQVGGATGAGGESPKLVLRRDANSQVWIDVWQDEPDQSAAHVLVKFARGKSERDRLILRSEFAYYRALTRLGFDTIRGEGLELHEGEGGPSLWLPRFDVERRDGREVRLGIESIYSLCGAAPGARLRHQDVLATLESVFPTDRWPEVVAEYVERDVLNLVFGNSDNHGRNMSVLRRADGPRLAPIYDFAPMKMDLEGVSRSTTWGPFERGGDVDFNQVFKSLGPHEPLVRARVGALARRLVDLPDLLREVGVPDETLSFQALGLFQTQARLRTWGLL